MWHDLAKLSDTTMPLIDFLPQILANRAKKTSQDIKNRFQSILSALDDVEEPTAMLNCTQI